MIERGSEWNRWDLHVHTASSYDYQYRGEDADDLLCKTLRDNGIRAVAITDHFIIDKKRIEDLRAKAPEIVFFPGVELRTDKGANNLHVILIFSDQISLDPLVEDFNAIMLRTKAKSSESKETIYWAFDDIIDFAKSHDALVTIHAGRKTNGIDKEITNALPVKEAIKADIACSVHFFEVGQIRDILDYEQHVFADIERKPLIMCSDCHNPKEYAPKESLWIKADLTFTGLKQCLYQPLERVFIGAIPPILDRLQKNRQSNIERIEIRRIDSPSNTGVSWFDADIPLNAGMVAIIGNKGSGKSALSDIIGHLCKTKYMHSASFLSDKRFRKAPKRYSKDYTATIHWADGESLTMSLDDATYSTTIEDAQYLPHQFIEAVCNDIENIFQREIDKVIFSYVDRTEKGDANDLSGLIQLKTESIKARITTLLARLHDVNTRIIRLEEKKTKAYRTQMHDGRSKLQETLVRHEKSKPAEVSRPEPKEEDKEYQEALTSINEQITTRKQNCDSINDRITELTTFIDDITKLINQIDTLEALYDEVKRAIDDFVRLHRIQGSDYSFMISSPKDYFISLERKAREEKARLQSQLNNPENGEYVEIERLEAKKTALISTADNDERAYQRYLADLAEWDKRRKEIIGDKETDGSLEYYENELQFITSKIDIIYEEALKERVGIVRAIFEAKSCIVSIYADIYAPVQGEISALLGSLEDSVSFQAELYMQNPNLDQEVFRYINQRYKGKFGKSSEPHQEFERLMRDTDFTDIDSIITFTNAICQASTEDLENAGKKILDRQGFYDFIYGLDYIGVSFKLKMGGRNLNELSPGERGIVLLIFYLALSKEQKPIIIDQPEDNLDNQSVFSKLVPCICKAKQHRQVIIVTHNPNIAVACDAEQIVYCEMDKEQCRISYESGSIENPTIRKHVVDVLEGTMPAFELRRLKYN